MPSVAQILLANARQTGQSLGQGIAGILLSDEIRKERERQAQMEQRRLELAEEENRRANEALLLNALQAGATPGIAAPQQGPTPTGQPLSGPAPGVSDFTVAGQPFNFDPNQALLQELDRARALQQIKTDAQLQLQAPNRVKELESIDSSNRVASGILSPAPLSTLDFAAPEGSGFSPIEELAVREGRKASEPKPAKATRIGSPGDFIQTPDGKINQLPDADSGISASERTDVRVRRDSFIKRQTKLKVDPLIKELQSINEALINHDSGKKKLSKARRDTLLAKQADREMRILNEEDTIIKEADSKFGSSGQQGRVSSKTDKRGSNSLQAQQEIIQKVQSGEIPQNEGADLIAEDAINNGFSYATRAEAEQAASNGEIPPGMFVYIEEEDALEQVQ